MRDSHDVVVVGGGNAGAIAAIAAARTGARTILIEQYGHLGGTLGLGMSLKGVFDGEGRRALGGIGEELLQKARESGGATEVSQHPRHGSIMGQDSELIKLILMTAAADSGVRLLLHTFFVDALAHGGRIQAIQVANKSGLELIPGRFFVDATGDADLAHRAGAGVVKGRERDGAMQPASSIFRVGGVDLGQTWGYLENHPEDFEMPPEASGNSGFLKEFRQTPGVGVAGFKSLIRKAREAGDYAIARDDFGFNPLPGRDDVTINLTRVHGCDATDPDSLAAASVEAQRQILEGLKFLRKYVPGFGDCFLVSNPFQIGVRETRRIIGAYVLDERDVRGGRDFPDQAARGAYPLDIHEVDASAGSGGTRGAAGGDTDLSRLRRSYGIPSRSLYPRELDNLAAAGRCIYGTHAAAGSFRGQPVCLATGHAAGVMAALCAADDVANSDLDVRKMRKELLRQGAVLDI